MEIAFNILRSLPVILFWSAVLSFVPIAYYLLIKNPPILKAEKMRDLGIFDIRLERTAGRAEWTRARAILIIYGLCAVFFSAIYFFNANRQQAGVRPFDVLSTLSVILLGVSVVTYLPIAFYLMLKNPWRDQEEGLPLTALFIGYGIVILIFSVTFVFRWLKASQMFVGLAEILSSLFIVFISSVFLAYLPVCLYIYRTIANPSRPKRVHPNVIFVIYSICFLLFASVFSVNWVADKRAGVQHRPLRVHFRL